MREFDRIRVEIQKERYCGPFNNPLTYGINRAIFDQQRFQRLIAEAAKVKEPAKAIHTRVAQWKRQYDRAVKIQQRLEATQKSTEASLFTGGPTA